jgi:hypothetical protein
LLLVRWRKSYGAVIDESLKAAVVPNVPNPAVVAGRRKYLECRRTVLCYQNAFVGVAVKPVGKPDALAGHVRFDERVVSRTRRKVRCCTKDEGWSFGAALWEEASNGRKLLW